MSTQSDNNYNGNSSNNSGTQHQNHIDPVVLVNLYKIGFKPVALYESHAPVDKTTPIYNNPGYWNIGDL